MTQVPTVTPSHPSSYHSRSRCHHYTSFIILSISILIAVTFTLTHTSFDSPSNSKNYRLNAKHVANDAIGSVKPPASDSSKQLQCITSGTIIGKKYQLTTPIYQDTSLSASSSAAFYEHEHESYQLISLDAYHTSLQVLESIVLTSSQDVEHPGDDSKQIDYSPIGYLDRHHHHQHQRQQIHDVLTHISGRSSKGESTGKDRDDIYELRHRFGRGAYGEVWRARKIHHNDDGASHDDTIDDSNEYVLKRLLIEKGAHVRPSGMREIHFGLKLADQAHMARFIEYFDDVASGELWLVFQYEGQSLHDYIYEYMTDHVSHNVQQQRSSLWWKMKYRIPPSNTHTDTHETIGTDTSLQHFDPADEQIEMKLHAIEAPLPTPLLSNTTTATTQSNTKQQQPCVECLGKLNHDAPSLRQRDADTSLPASTTSYSLCNRHAHTDAYADDPLKSIIRQLLEGVAVMHHKGTTHRDIKPQNLLFQSRPHRCPSPNVNENHGAPDDVLNELSASYLRICDFGSAIDSESLASPVMFPHLSPIELQSTMQYAPPEVLFTSSPFHSIYPTSYDMFSVGVVILEIILGTPNVFTVDDRTRVIIESRLGASANQQLKEKAILLRAMIDMCIYQPTTYIHAYSDMNGDGGKRMMDIECSDEDFNNALKRIDPTGIGIDNPVLINLVRRLLAWKAEDRITAHDALLHPYFHIPPIDTRTHNMHDNTDDAICAQPNTDRSLITQ